MEHKTISIADQIFEQIEHDILVGEYERGTVLTENKLSEKLGVSRTPIRESLRRLSEEHLIEETSKGAVVVGISPEDVFDLYEIRFRLEGLAARKAAENATDEDIAEMKKILELQEFFTTKQDADNIKDQDTDFHKALYKASKSQVIYYTLMPIHKKLMKYRKASMTQSSRAGHSFSEHQAILDAIVGRDPRAAENAAVLHIMKARESLMFRE